MTKLTEEAMKKAVTKGPKGSFPELGSRARQLATSVTLGAVVGVLAGVASALFLHLLDRATVFREAHRGIVYTLPIAGIAIGLVYERWGAPIKGGNNLVLDTLHDDAARIPLRMAPMVLLGTVLTHLFGGSAGREGTAVQMGASLADAVAHRFQVGRAQRRQLLAAGIAGGFGSVFGTPFAGLVFGLEVASIGRFERGALGPALVASLVGDAVTRRLGVVHTAYPTIARVELSLGVLAKTCVIGVTMGLVSLAFVVLLHRLKALFERAAPRLPVRMFVGGIAIVIAWKVVSVDDYLGLGVPGILRAFQDPTLPGWAFAAKMLFTTLTLASGFLGGEVTPLFFVGATLGSVLGRMLGLPIEFGAAVGIAAVFGAAANTPLSLTIMVVELVGVAALPHVLVVTALAYLVSGHRSIYPAQRLVRRKLGGRLLDRPVPLRDYRDP